MLANKVTEIMRVLWCLIFSTALKKKRCSFCYLKLSNIYHVLWKRNNLCTCVFSLCMPCMLQLCLGAGRLAEYASQCCTCQQQKTLFVSSVKAHLWEIQTQLTKKPFLLVDFYISTQEVCVYVLCTLATLSCMDLLHICHMADLPVDSGHLSK